MRLPTVLIGLFLATTCRAAVVYDFTPVTQQVDAMLQAHPAVDGASLIVIRNGAVVYEHHFGNFTPGTKMPIASASKWLSALAIERLVAQGTMRWDDTIGLYLPDAPADKRGITLGQLFSHTSGLPHDEDPCLSDQIYYALASCAQEILTLPLAHAPGTAFAYTGNGMQIGGYMATIATGKSWAQIFADEVATPLGMTDTDFGVSPAPPYVPVPNPRIAGGARSTLGDYARVVEMVAQHGLWNGVPFLSADEIADMQMDQTHGATVVFSPNGAPFGYGYGEWRDAVDAQGVAVQVSSTGAFGTSPWVDNATGVGAVFFTFSVGGLDKSEIVALWANVHAVVSDPVFSDGFEPADP